MTSRSTTMAAGRRSDGRLRLKLGLTLLSLVILLQVLLTVLISG